MLLTLAAMQDTQQIFGPGTAEQILTAGIRAPQIARTSTTKPPEVMEPPVSAQHGRLTVTGGQDGTLQWREGGGNTSTVKVANSAVASLGFNQAGTVLLAGLDSGPALWINVRTRAVTAVCPGAPGDSASVGFLDGSTPQTISKEGRARTWKRNLVLPAAVLSDIAIHSVSYAPSGGKVAAGGANTHVFLLDGPSLAIQGEWENKPVRSGPVQEVAWSPDGHAIAAVHGDGLLNFWTPSGKNFDFASYKRTLWSVAWRPDSKAAAVASSEGAVYLISLPAPKTPPDVPVRHKDRVVCVRIAPSGQFIASSGWDGALRFTPLAGGVRVRSLENVGVISDLAFGPEPLIVAAQWDGSVRVYNYTTGQTTATLEGHNGPVTAVAFHPGGKQIASGGKDGTVRMWDLETNQEIMRFAEHSGTVTDVTYSPDGKRLLSSGADGFVRSWATSQAELIALARQSLSRDLTDEECRQYLKRANACGQYGSLRSR